MSINVNELINAARSIVKGEGDYILITKEELMETCKSFHETKKDIESRLEPKEPITEQPAASEPKETATVPVTYKSVKYGEADPNDSAGDIEMSNKPVYYVPVGDGLYRPTADRRIFLFHACLALYKAGLTNASYGDQYKYLIDNGFESYDICLAVKAKEADIVRMIGKETDDVPYYVRTKWVLCFGVERPWHPVHIKKLRAEKTIEQEQEEQNKKTIERIFAKEEGEQTSEEPKSLVGSKYYIKTIISEDETPINFNDYPNFLNVCVRKDGARGCGTSYPNLDAISNWLKEDTEASKVLPHKDLKSFTSWCADYQISARQFLAMFDRQYNAQLAFTKDLVNAINTRLGIEFLTATAKRNPRKQEDKPESNKEAKPTEPEYIRIIRRKLWSQRKWGITTIKKLFALLEPEVSRQQIIDTFHISEYELNNPCELTNATATEINKFCGKAVCYGRG